MNPQILTWARGVAGQFIEGASDSFLAVMGANTAAQMSATTLSAVTPRQLFLSMAILGGVYVASYLKKNPTPWAMSPAAPAPISAPPAP